SQDWRQGQRGQTAPEPGHLKAASASARSSLPSYSAPLDGAISGRALYDGKLDLAEALAALR
ncbi:MAG: hypothetical protein QNJ16_15320, partial [Rhodobacter sp.]|nr:hypothetical protein [Rhodobacter sp.]